MNEQEIMKAVNPSYMTGKGCLMLLMAAGEPDAVKLGANIDISELMRNTNEVKNDSVQNEILGAYRVAHDARYAVWNRIAQESDCAAI